MKKIVWTKLAQQSRKEIFEYWNNRNKSTKYSRKLNALFLTTIKLIAQYNDVGVETSFGKVRAKSIKDYFIFYTYNSDTIYVLLVWDTRQNPERLEKMLNI